eukprot:m.7315 g.7315  ORF g.7315 m.7315 type:complete len:503 (+) comp2893_c0_seq2:2-1510(+)
MTMTLTMKWVVVTGLLAAATAASGDAVASSDKLLLDRIRSSAESRFMVDEHGRTRLFRGINAVEKGFPWYPQWLDKSRMAQLQDWGFDFIRLGFMWSGAQPAPGPAGFNATYYSIMKQMVADLASHGIYTMLDMHQDGFSSMFCLYDGIPLWNAQRRTQPRHDFPWPLSGNCSRFWEANFMTEAMGEAYQDLYNNHNGMQDALADFWAHTATEFRDTDIIGYELINEPWAGDVFADPLLFLPGQAGKINLAPMYEELSAALRPNDPDHLIFFEPVTWGMIFNGSIAGSGFDHVPGGDAWRNASVFSYHYYCFFFSNDGKGETILQRGLCDGVLGELVFYASHKDADRLGGAAMLTEWGFDTTNCDPGALEENGAVMELADLTLASWSYWPTASGGALWKYGSSTVVECGVKSLSRAHLQAVAGTPTRQVYDPEGPTFTATFEFDPKITAPTLVYLPQAMVEHTLDISLQPSDMVHSLDGHVLSIAPGSNATAGIKGLSVKLA